MLLCLRLKHLSGPNDPSWVLSGKGMLPNWLQATLTGLQVTLYGSSGDPKQVFRYKSYRGFLKRNTNNGTDMPFRSGLWAETCSFA